jgi:anti-sigma-K factor RskA
MNCDDIHELLAAYAIDALDANDARAVREHLASCRNHDDELAELAGVVGSLPTLAEEREPRPELRSRLLRAFDAEVARGAAGPGEQRVIPFVRRAAFAWLAAAALFMAVIGLTTWNVVLQTSDGEREGGWTVSAELTGEGVDGHFWYLDRQQLAVLSMDAMPELEPEHVYQAWAYYDGQPVSLGMMPTEHTFAMKADLHEATRFAITIEPMGGSDQPSDEPIAVAEMR